MKIVLIKLIVETLNRSELNYDFTVILLLHDIIVFLMCITPYISTLGGNFPRIDSIKSQDL